MSVLKSNHLQGDAVAGVEQAIIGNTGVRYYFLPSPVY
jgi:hypothetical protein